MDVSAKDLGPPIDKTRQSSIYSLEVIDLVEELRERGRKGVVLGPKVSAYGGAYLYVGATTLLGFPVAQGRLAEIHAPYLSLFSGEMKKRRSSKSGLRASSSPFDDDSWSNPPCSQGTLQRR